MTCETIGVVRAMTDGDVAVLLCRVLVTYVFPQGWFVQEAAAGPAIEIFEGSAWTPDVAVGDEVTIPVTSLSTYHGTKTVYAHDVVTVHSSGNSIASYIEDVSAGTPLGEDNECEPVRITDGIVDAVAGLDVTVTYGTASGAALRVADASGFCAGARFDVVAPGTEWDGAYRVQSFQAADFTRIDTTACAGGGRVPVPGDLLLNEFLADPPADLPGDANCDGIRDGSSQQDEFVELVNVSADRLSLAGVTVSDTVGVRHTFSAGTSLDAGGVIVVFGGGSPSCTWPSGVQVVTAGDGQLGLNNTGDTLTVAVGAGASAVTLQRTTFGSEGGRDTSLTLSPDLTDTNVDPAIPGGFVAHTTADTADASPFSPGTRIDGSAL
ncbi:MAG: lamin tail domain-containing protein [Deltaproteobacteria bacterium]|nr:lamin tail domain-containing protein [Deltaproteobacteria bacterium]